MEQSILELLNGIYPVDLYKVETVTNEMFRCTATEGEYFARVTNYKGYDEQLEEIIYTNYLHSEGLGVSPTIESVNGQAVEKITISNKEVLTVLYEAAPGKHLSRNQWKPDVLKELGRQIGKLHRYSRKFEEIHPTKYIKDWHQNEEYNFLKYIPEEETKIREVAQEILAKIKNLPKDKDNYGLLHGDLWLENVVVDHDLKLSLVDFQDCEKHFYIFDLAVPIYSAVEYSFVGSGNIVDYGRSITKAIIEGYKE